MEIPAQKEFVMLFIIEYLLLTSLLHEIQLNYPITRFYCFRGIILLFIKSPMMRYLC